MEENTIFVHAGIDEEAGDMWEWETSEDVFTSKYPAETGKIEGLDMKVVAGHVLSLIHILNLTTVKFNAESIGFPPHFAPIAEYYPQKCRLTS